MNKLAIGLNILSLSAVTIALIPFSSGDTTSGDVIGGSDDPTAVFASDKLPVFAYLIGGLLIFTFGLNIYAFLRKIKTEQADSSKRLRAG